MNTNKSSEHDRPSGTYEPSDNKPAGGSQPETTIRKRFKTSELQLLETDPSAWFDQTTKRYPILVAVHAEAKKAATEQRPSVLFYQYYIPFFREVSLLDIPLDSEWDSEWLALVFESAYDLANVNRERAEAWLDESGAERIGAQRTFKAFLKGTPRGTAHRFVRRVVHHSKPENYKEIVESGRGTKWLIESAESYFWAGIHAATAAQFDPEAVDLIEFFDTPTKRPWGDYRFHANLVRTAPVRCNGSIKGTFDHPLLRIADEKYRNSPAEGKVICEILEKLCISQGIASESEAPDRDLNLAQWVREGFRFGERLLKNYPVVLDGMLQTASGYSGDALLSFYKRRLSGVKDWNDPLDVTLAFLAWLAEERGVPNSRYYGERLETIANCVDAAIYLPWAQANHKCGTEQRN